MRAERAVELVNSSIRSRSFFVAYDAVVLVDASSVLVIKTLAKRLFRFAGPDAASARETSCIFGSEERRSHVLAPLACTTDIKGSQKGAGQDKIQACQRYEENCLVDSQIMGTGQDQVQGCQRHEEYRKSSRSHACIS